MPAVRPDHASAPVADDDGDVRVALPAAGPVHTDRAQPVEHARHRGLQPAGDPSGDAAGGPPRDMRETAHGPLAGDRHQPCAPGSEAAGEPAARPGPRHPGDHHAARTAFHPRDRAGKPDAEATEALMPPASPAPPLSYLGAFRPQREQRDAPFPHLTRATRTGAPRSGESSNDTSPTTMSSTFSNRLNMLFNQGAFPGRVPGRKTNPQETPLTPSHSTAQRRATTHENNTRARFF